MKKRLVFPFDPYILIILTVAIISRLFVYTIVPKHIANPWDSVDYGRFAQQIIHEGHIKNIFNLVRPPMYPLVIAGSFVLTGVREGEDIYGVLNDRGGLPVALLQTAVGIVSVLVIYKTLKRFTRGVIAGIFSLLYAIHPLIVPWDRYILTESLSISVTVFFLYAAIVFLEKQGVSNGFFVILLGVLCTWIRSMSVVFVPLTLGIAFVKKRNLEQAVRMYAFGIIFFLPIALHIMINGKFYGTPTLQVMSTINLYGRMLIHPYTIPIMPNNRISSWMQAHFDAGLYQNPFPILESLTPDLYHDQALLKELEDYNRHAIVLNVPKFFLDLIGDFPKMYEVNLSTVFPDSPGWYLFLQRLFVLGTAVSSFLLCFLPSVCMYFFRQRRRLPMIVVFSGFGFGFFLITSVVFGYVDSSRYMLGGVPFLFLYTAGLGELFLQSKYAQIVHFIRRFQ